MSKPTCSIEGCPDLVTVAGKCSTHYQRIRRYGDPNVVLVPKRGPKCSIEGCPGKHKGHGWCEPHLELWKRYGDPLGPGPRIDNPGERWMSPGSMEGCYEISSQGRIWSVPRLSADGKRKILGRFLIPNGSPYLSVMLYINGRNKRRTVHSLVTEAFHGPCPKGMEARHLDDNKLNNTAENLCWGPRSANMQDRRRNGIMYQLNRTHCKNRHQWTDANTIIVYRRDGSFKQRVCRQCRTDRNYRRKELGAA